MKQSSKGALTLSINKNILSSDLVHLGNTYYIWLESAVFCLETAKLVIFQDSNLCNNDDLSLTIFEAHEKMHTARFPFHITQAHNGLVRLGFKLIRLPKLTFFPSCYKIDEVWASTTWDSNMRLHDVEVMKNTVEPQIDKIKNRNGLHYMIKSLSKWKKVDEISKKLKRSILFWDHQVTQVSRAWCKNYYMLESKSEVFQLIPHESKITLRLHNRLRKSLDLLRLIPSLHSRLDVSELLPLYHVPGSTFEDKCKKDVRLKSRCRFRPDIRYSILYPLLNNSYKLKSFKDKSFLHSNLCFWRIPEFPRLSEILVADADNHLGKTRLPCRQSNRCRNAYRILLRDQNISKVKDQMFSMKGSKQNNHILCGLRHAKVDVVKTWFLIEPVVSVRMLI
jgi:hypothetical protein